MSFKAYIGNRRVTDTPAGDFTSDANQDPNLPEASSWGELKHYLSIKTTDPNVLNAARQVWQSYLRHNKK